MDWSYSWHDVAIIDQDGEPVAAFKVSNDTDGVTQLLGTLSGVAGRRRRVPVGIETGRGLFVAKLRQAGQPVVVLNPTLLARYRARLAPSPRKTDRSDAALAAHVLRVDGAAHRPLPTNSPLVMAIQQVARAQWRAVRQRVRHQICLDGLLWEFHPALREACAGLPAGLAGAQGRELIAAAYTPAKAARLTPRQLEDLLRQAGRVRNVDDQVDRLTVQLRRGQLRQPRPIEQAMGQDTLSVLAMMTAAAEAAEKLATQLEELFDQHPHAPIYRSFPGLGALLGARLLGELGDDPDRFTDARALRAFCGATPLTWSSGTTTIVRRRRNTHPFLATTGYLWAFAALTASPGARAFYDRRRETGDRHATTLRRLYSRLLGQLHHCLTTGQHYHEHRAYPTHTADP